MASVESRLARLEAMVRQLQGATDWEDLTPYLLNSWTAYISPEFRRAGRYVECRGELQAWTGGVTAGGVAIFSFPDGFWPSGARVGCPVWVHEAGGHSVYVESTGVVRVAYAVAASNHMNLNGIRFPVD